VLSHNNLRKSYASGSLNEVMFEASCSEMSSNGCASSVANNDCDRQNGRVTPLNDQSLCVAKRNGYEKRGCAPEVYSDECWRLEVLNECQRLLTQSFRGLLNSCTRGLGHPNDRDASRIDPHKTQRRIF
jgi:hypothetical protein